MTRPATTPNPAAGHAGDCAGACDAQPALRTPWTQRESRSVRRFLATETGSAGVLLAATLLALLWANSPWSATYFNVWHTALRITLGDVGAIDLDLQDWVNDGLMVWFFYIVGLEIRRELALGELRDRRAAAVPAIAALAGMIAPALVYVAFNAGGPAANGWGIVMATDIAFVLGTLALLGSRVPPGVRVFLLTLAIVDDVGAIAVIAVFYSHGFSVAWFLAAACILAAVIALLRFGPVWRGPAYFVAGLLLWFATLQSGIHPTIAGVLMGLITTVHPPQRADVERAASITRLFRRTPTPDAGRAAVLEIGNAVSANERFQQAIHPWTSYLVIPIFAVANAGVPLGDGRIPAALGSVVTIGVLAGLVVGKAVGVSAATLSAVRLRVGPLPTGVGSGHVMGAATLAGIGFTVSLFVTDLAFDDELLRDQAKLGVLGASLISAIAGLGILARRPRADAAHAVTVAHLQPAVDPVYDRVRGPNDAPHTLVVFGDYACPHTRALAPVLHELLHGDPASDTSHQPAQAPDGGRGRPGGGGDAVQSLPDGDADAVRIVWRQLPNEDAAPGTALASEAALAAASQGAFWPFHDRLLAHPSGDDLGAADLLDVARLVGLDVDRVADDLRHHVRAPAVQSDITSAARSGVEGTPTIFLDGVRYDGPHQAKALRAALHATTDTSRWAG